MTLLLAGSTSWSCGWPPAPEAPAAPPGVINTVPAGGGAIAALLLLELLELELELELALELELPGDPHGSIATVCVNVLAGISITFDPGGILLEPDWTTLASEHEVTASVRGLCCLGITTVLTPGLWSAAVTGLLLELLLELLLPAQPAAPANPAHSTKAKTARVRATRCSYPCPDPD